MPGSLQIPRARWVPPPPRESITTVNLEANMQYDAIKAFEDYHLNKLIAERTAVEETIANGNVAQAEADAPVKFNGCNKKWLYFVVPFFVIILAAAAVGLYFLVDSEIGTTTKHHLTTPLFTTSPYVTVTEPTSAVETSQSPTLVAVDTTILHPH